MQAEVNWFEEKKKRQFKHSLDLDITKSAILGKNNQWTKVLKSLKQNVQHIIFITNFIQEKSTSKHYRTDIKTNTSTVNINNLTVHNNLFLELHN